VGTQIVKRKKIAGVVGLAVSEKVLGAALFFPGVHYQGKGFCVTNTQKGLGKKKRGQKSGGDNLSILLRV